MFNTKHKHQRINLKLLYAFLVFMTFAVIYNRVQLQQEKERIVDLPKIKAKGELKALTLYSSTSYFIYRDKEMGYEYEICSQLAHSLGLKLKMVIAPNQKTMMEMLERGEGDLIAYNIPVTPKNNKKHLFCGREYLTHQVLVQQRKAPSKMLTDKTDLIGKKVLVQGNTKYDIRLNRLNKELGGGIRIETIKEDSLSVEDLIGMVAMGQIDYTVADNNIARFNKTFYKNINTSLVLSQNQHSFWAVRETSPMLASAINEWFRKNVQSRKYKSTSKRYFELSKGPNPFLTTGLIIRKDGSISSYDNLFKKHATNIGWDWRLLASIAYQESNFDATATNWTGASGLMQIMPRTAKSMGIDVDSLLDAETSIRGAARLLKGFEKNLSKVTNKEQRQKMVLASFNCGLGHILDARALARKHQKNPNRWDGDNVGKYIYLKSRPEYYQDPVCKQGYLRGSETAAFVTEVWTRYKYYVNKVMF
jgi:membrane-bound lytic murein transglycosylase F